MSYRLKSALRVWFARRFPSTCRTCRGYRVVRHAGSLEADDGFQELRRCSICSDGERIGRSDQPICTVGA